jgi:hypothetical protein
MTVLLRYKNTVCVGLLLLTISCTDIPTGTGVAQTAGNSGTANGTTQVASTPASKITPTPSNTQTPTITLTSTPPPDVELSQLQIVEGQYFFAEIVNHLDVPVIFEDQQSPFHFDIFDPILNQHFVGDEPIIDRYESIDSIIPCVVYPGEPVYFWGGLSSIREWFFALADLSEDYTKNINTIQISYQSLAKPWPDWKENDTHDKVWDITWHFDSKVLYFSFRHTPIIYAHGNGTYTYGSMGLYDKDDHLLGVGWGWMPDTIDTGIDDNYWISLDKYTPGYNNKYEWNWFGLDMDAIKARLDHIQIILETFPGVDGICIKRVPTKGPIQWTPTDTPSKN